MKRLVATLTLILCLSFPVFAGHVQVGGYGWCECDNPESHNTLNGPVQESAPESETLGLLLVAVLLYLKARA
jgi:hypothetical protein